MAAYEETNRGIVVKYLTRNVGFEQAKEMMRYRNIPDDMIHAIETCILVPKLNPKLGLQSQQPPLNIDDDSVREHAKRYLIRAYGEIEGIQKLDARMFTEFDTKMIRTMMKLKGSYDTIQGNRRNTIMTTKHEMLQENTDRDISEKKKDISAKKKELSSTKKDSSSKKKISTLIPSPEAICRAYKMNGEKCTAKTKKTDGFCARHTKK
jgi:hypothetical protein